MRWLLIPLLVLHALIHLLGFALAWGGTVMGRAGGTLVPLGGLTSRMAGVACLLTCLAMLGVALGLALGRGWWRPVALIAAAVSQLLIVLWWPDARAGTLANLLIAAAVAWQPGRVVWRAAPRANARA